MPDHRVSFLLRMRVSVIQSAGEDRENPKLLKEFHIELKCSRSVHKKKEQQHELEYDKIIISSKTIK